jgi:predicted transcriptional regulator
MDRTISFRAPVSKVRALDALAASQERDRTYLLNQAIDYYLELNQYHTALITRGIEQADAGELVDHSQIRRMVVRLRRKK